MDWGAFWAGAEHFILTVGWKIAIVLSAPALLWKFFDMRSKTCPICKGKKS